MLSDEFLDNLKDYTFEELCAELERRAEEVFAVAQEVFPGLESAWLESWRHEDRQLILDYARPGNVITNFLIIPTSYCNAPEAARLFFEQEVEADRVVAAAREERKRKKEAEKKKVDLEEAKRLYRIFRDEIHASGEDFQMPDL